MKAELNIKNMITGRYKFKVLRADRTVKVETPWFDNLITDLCLELIGEDASAMWSRCSVGTGTTAPSFTDTQLVSRVATTTTTVSGSITTGTHGAPDYYAYYAITYEFAAGVAAGNLTEVGVGRSSDGTELQSRALIVDSMGNPTTITVLSDEILQVAFERRHYVPQSDVTGSIDISGTNYNFTLRATNSNNATAWRANLSGSGIFASTAAPRGARAYDGPMGATIEDTPTGANSNRSSVSSDSYSAGSHERSGTITWGLTDGNFAEGIKSIQFSTDLTSTYQVEFDPAIPKNDTQILELNVKHSWGRHTP